MSEWQAQQHYIEACYNALSDNGWLVANFHDLTDDDSILMKTLKDLFPEMYVCDVFKGNRVVFCGKNADMLEMPELNDRARLLMKQVDMPLLYYFKQLKLLKN